VIRPHRDVKDTLYGELARVGKALAAPQRLELLDLLAQGPRTVERLAAQASLSVANTSRHLQILRAARLVASKKQGVHVEYRLADEQVLGFTQALRQVAESRLAEIRQVTRNYLVERGALEEVGGEELLRRVRRGEVTVLDVRPPEEYRAGHLPGAISIPVGELSARLGELPREREVVAYCRGPYCVMALDAVELLRKEGFTAHRMEHGVPEWRSRGWRVVEAR